jgi:assimilatory nitrate reductase catalytic subunit
MTVATTCPYCGVGCGVKAKLMEGRALSVSGDEAHPANQGQLCSKGTALGGTFSLKGRLLGPKRRTEEGLKDVSWSEALDEVANTFRRIIAEHGPDAVAFYVSGQLLSEDYYAVNKLAKGFIGTANIDTNSRLCMASAVAAQKLSFGADLVPAIYDDLDIADLLIFSGHNAAWTHPVLYRRIETRIGQKRICIDPKRTDTSKAADLHLMLRPQTDVRLWNGLSAYLIRENILDHDFIAAHTDGFDALKAELSKDDQSLEAIAKDCGLETKDVATFYEAFGATPKTVSLFSQGSNQSTQGVSKGLSLINAHLLSGKIGKPGAAPFSITGQPNAMGGREVGGLSNMLAAHMDFDEDSKSRVQRYWNSPTIAQTSGLKAVDMFEAVHSGKIKAIWIMATNPLVSLPNTDRVRDALKACELVVVSDVVEHTDTMALAHFQLPAAAWGEKDGTVTNSERMISRQRNITPLPEQVRPDWAIVAEVAKKINPDWSYGFNWQGADEVFSEYAGLTAFENNGTRFLDLGGLEGLDRQGFDSLTPTRWPYPKGHAPSGRLFTNGRFATASGRAQLRPVRAKGPAHPQTPNLPFSLNTTRIRDQWHTMTRTGLAPELNQHMPEPLLDIHPNDAKALGIQHGRLARVKTDLGEAIIKANVTEDVRQGDLSLPIHWTRLLAPFGRSNGLIHPAVDPVSGQPEFKHTPASVGAYNELWHGFVMIAKDSPDLNTLLNKPLNQDVIWRLVQHAASNLYEISGHDFDHSFDRFSDLFDPEQAISLKDETTGLRRQILIEDNQLKGVLFLAPIDKTLPSRHWLVERFEDETISAQDRSALLIGRLPNTIDPGRIICACNGIGQKIIEAAIFDGANSIEAIGEVTCAGTACGSCKGELKQLLLSLSPISDQTLINPHANTRAICEKV